MSTYDLLIIGSGIVGATTALALAKKTSLRIALLDVKEIAVAWSGDSYDHRVSAISPASESIFRQLGVWDAMAAKRVSPYQKMHVWDASTPSEMTFDCRSIHLSVLGHIIEESVIRSSLIAQFSQFPHLDVIAPCKLIALHERPDDIALVTEHGEALCAKMVIGADGAHSWVREQAKIEMTQWDYAHAALVTTVTTELPHQRTAWQRFLPSGPLAFLPLLDEHQCSIVWSMEPSEVTRLLALDHADFQHELTRAFANQLGTVTATASRYRFPLHMRHVKNYVKSRVVLVGDAAHTLHPLAGQGVNLGLLDSACLVDTIATALAKERDFASLSVLRRYERWRKADNLAMLVFVEVMKQLFASDAQFMIALRRAGMRMTNKMDFMKAFFANHATGNRADMPTLAIYP